MSVFEHRTAYDIISMLKVYYERSESRTHINPLGVYRIGVVYDCVNGERQIAHLSKNDFDEGIKILREEYDIFFEPNIDPEVGRNAINKKMAAARKAVRIATKGIQCDTDILASQVRDMLGVDSNTGILKAINELKMDRNNYKQRLELTAEANDYIKEKCAETKKELAKAEEDIMTLKKERDSFRAEATAIKKELDAKKARLNTVEKELKWYRDMYKRSYESSALECSRLNYKMADLITRDNDILSLVKELGLGKYETVTEALEAITGSYKKLETDHTYSTKKYYEMVDSLYDCNRKRKMWHEKYEKEHADSVKYCKLWTKVKNDLEKANKQVKELQTQVYNSNVAINALKNEIRKLKEQHD